MLEARAMARPSLRQSGPHRYLAAGATFDSTGVLIQGAPVILGNKETSDTRLSARDSGGLQCFNDGCRIRSPQTTAPAENHSCEY